MTNFINKYNEIKEDKQRDDLLRSALNQMLDRKLKSEIEEEMVTVKLSPSTKKSKILRIAIRTASIAATIALLILGYQQFFVQPDPIQMASMIVSQEMIAHPGIAKGETSILDSRTEAVKAFNQGEFAIALDLFNQIQNRSEQDIFYQGCAALKSGKYELSIRLLNTFKDNPNSAYQEEAKWYLALAHVLNKNFDQAITLLKQMDPGEWKYEEAELLLIELQ